MYMKKIFLSVTLLLALLLNKNISASELILYSEDGFEIKTSSFVQDEAKYISLVKGSNLNITFTPDKDLSKETAEPKIDLKIYKKDTKDVVFSAKTPSKKMSGNEGVVFDSYLQENKLYFDTVSLPDNKVVINIPLKFSGGEYDVNLKIDTGVKKSNLEYSFLLSDSSYKFTTSNIIVEDTNVLANIGYVSLLETDETNKVVVTLTRAGKEIFRKEFDKKFYVEGSVIVDEKIPALAELVGTADLKIEIKDKDGKVILTESKVVDLHKKSNTSVYYMILGILILLLIVLFVIFKRKKARTFIAIIALMSLGSFGFLMSSVNAATSCGTKPADKCFENKIITHICEKTELCENLDIRVKKFFSTGNVLNIPSSSQQAGPASISVNICSSIAETVSDGDKFYVVSDTLGSYWTVKRYHIFSFTKGSSNTVTFDPGGDKRNASYAVYNGSCMVTVSSEYRGDDTDFPTHKTIIIEAGKITGGMCKSRVVNDDLFENNGALLLKDNCSNSNNDGLRNTYIAGSVYMTPVTGTSAWSDKTVNICNQLGVTGVVAPGGSDNFYALFELYGGGAAHIRFPIYQFKFGVARKNVPDLKSAGTDANGHNIKEMYRYTGDKENVPSVSYDGGCNITFRLYYYGYNTDSWSFTYRLMELGMVDNATCRDPALTDSTVYKYDGNGISPGQVERETKFPISNPPGTYGGWGGRYANIAKFFYGTNGTGSVSSGALPVCRAASSCGLDYDWRESATNGSCPPPTVVVNPSCGGTNNTCTPGTVNDTGTANTDTPTQYKWTCNGSSGITPVSCVVNKPTVSTAGVCGTTNNICSAGTLDDDNTNPANIDTTTQYNWTCKGLNDGADTSCPLTKTVVETNGSCGATLNTCNPGTLQNDADAPDEYRWTCLGSNYTIATDDDSCSLPLTVTPPTIELTKDPKVTLNKGGKCTISWDIQNIPAGGNCVLSGWGINTIITPNATSSTTIFGLVSNQKYVLTCSGGGMTTIFKSVICRVNPDIIEN